MAEWEPKCFVYLILSSMFMPIKHWLCKSSCLIYSHSYLGLKNVVSCVFQVEIVSCSDTHLYLWTMKGQLLASINASCGPNANILCCCFTQKHEWDPRNVIITGCADGIVRVRSELQNRPEMIGLCSELYNESVLNEKSSPKTTPLCLSNKSFR